MAKKSKKATPKAASPRSNGLAIPPAAAGGIRESFGKAREAGLEHNRLRREFVGLEKRVLEKQTLYEREFNERVEAAAQALQIDPAQHTVNLQTMAFEPRK